MPLRLIKVLFVFLFSLTPLFFLPWTSELFEFNKLTLTYIVTTAVISLWLLRMVLEKQIIFKRSLADIPLLLLLATTLISLLFSIDTHTSWIGYYGRWNGGLLSLISYAALYWSFVSNMDVSSTRQVVRYGLITATIIAIYGILEHLGFSFSCLFITGQPGVDCWVQDVRNRVFATLGQPNWLAAYIIALLFIPLSQISQKQKSQHLNITTSILLFICLVATKSRSGFLAFGIGSLVFWFYEVKQSGQTLIKNTKLLATFGIFILALLLVPNPLRDYVIKTTDSAPKTAGTALESGGTESGAIRKIVWQGAIDVWRQSTKTILIGTGPETFAMAYYNHRPLAHNNTSEWELLYNKAHNEFLNQLSTTGILGFSAYLILLVSLTKILINSKQYALLAGWVTLSVTNFWGFSVVTSQLLLFVLPAIAIVLSRPESAQKNIKSPTSLGLYWLLIAIIASASMTVFWHIGKSWISDLHYAASQKHMAYFNRSETPDPQELVDAYTRANTAYDLNPNEPFIDTQLADSAAYMAIYMQESDATTSAQLEKLAAAASQKALSISPRHPLHFKSAARTYILLSALNPDYLQTADQLLEFAQTLSPTDPRIPYNRAIIAKYNENKSAAEEFLNTSLKLKPDFNDAIQQLRQIASDSAKNKQ